MVLFEATVRVLNTEYAKHLWKGVHCLFEDSYCIHVFRSSVVRKISDREFEIAVNSPCRYGDGLC